MQRLRSLWVNIMIRPIIEFLIAIGGLAVTPILFYHFPKLPPKKSSHIEFPLLSIIIPARNEEHSLPLLLKDLQDQSFALFEIICVDDNSTDLTAHTAKNFSVPVLSLHNKPDDWAGKCWACQNGANAASGDLLLFIDADVRLGQDAIYRLLQAYCDCNIPISVQPFHILEKNYEQLSMFFNFIQLAANGTTLKNPSATGLYGPIILISRSDYKKIGGHESVKQSVVEDMALANRLKESNIPYKVFVGDHELAFRMYGTGIKNLFQGWTKNIATGAANTPIDLLIMVFLWTTSVISTPVHILLSAISAKYFLMLIYTPLYITWVFLLNFYAKKIGLFKLWAIIFFPIPLATFILIFAISGFKKILGFKVTWKERSIK
ncbi:glycosyltransferase family 2 protein [Eubacteriaceae bacterium ES3]|nr:glycosyltransferase family 2 protein [Eubacteriaceae bacterium ES3]